MCNLIVQRSVKWWSRLGLGLGVALFTGSSGAMSAQSPAPTRSQLAANMTAGAAPGDERPGRPALSPMVGISDRIKIRFMEHLDIAEPAPAPSGDATAPRGAKTFFERMDLSDDYEVQIDGSISLPRLGTVSAAGRRLNELQQELANLFGRIMGRPCDVSLAITDRPPVYVNGTVRSPGAFKYVPGMLALHGLSLAGGIDRNQDRQARLVEEIRERERLQSATARLQRLLAQKARLEAQSDGLEVAEAGAELMRHAEAREAKALMRSENRKLAAALKSHRVKLKTLSRAADEARREVAILQTRNERLKNLVTVRSERLKGIQEISTRGHAGKANVLAINSELVEAETRYQDGLVTIAQANQRLTDAERALQDFEIDQKAALEMELARVEDESREAIAAVGALKGVLGIMSEGNGGSMAGIGERALEFEIIRRTAGGPVRFSIGEMTELQPGDLLQIRLAAPVKSASARAPEPNAPTP